jgi:hypothetical protein
MTELSEEPLCGQYQGSTTFVTDDGRRRHARKNGKGELVDAGTFGLRGGRITTESPFDPLSCFHGAWTEHELHYVYAARNDEAPVPRGEFNPRFDREYRHTFAPPAINLGRDHSSDLNSAHTFTAQTKLEIRIESASERRFDKLVRRYQGVPAVDNPTEAQAEYHESPG